MDIYSIIGMIILGLVTGTVTSMIVALIFVFLGIAMLVVHLIKWNLYVKVIMQNNKLVFFE